MSDTEHPAPNPGEVACSHCRLTLSAEEGHEEDPSRHWWCRRAPEAAPPTLTVTRRDIEVAWRTTGWTEHAEEAAAQARRPAVARRLSGSTVAAACHEGTATRLRAVLAASTVVDAPEVDRG